MPERSTATEMQPNRLELETNHRCILGTVRLIKEAYERLPESRESTAKGKSDGPAELVDENQ